MAFKGKTLVVLPAYNEALVIAKTLRSLRSQIDADVLVVDDGSSDKTAEIAKKNGAIVVRHAINLGLGASLETGFEVARGDGYETMVTFDADGQHNPKDIQRLLDNLSGRDVSIGVRTINMRRMPAIKKVGNAILNILTGCFFGIWCRDSQSGLRAFNKTAIHSMRLRARGYAVSSEILFEAKRKGLRIGEVPVEAIYTDYSKARGTGIWSGVQILWRMLLHQEARR